MPAEVYSISGALGAEAACPAGWAVTPNGNCGAPTGNCPPNFMTKTGACRSVLALHLQNALRSLGLTIGDKDLSGITVDGFVGPQTVSLANKALTAHVGAGQASSALRTGDLSQVDVAARAHEIAEIIAGEVVRRGGKVTRKVPVVVPPGPVVPVPGTTFPTKLWALVGLEVLAIGIGVYGVVRRRQAGPGVELPSNISPFPEAA